MAGAGRLCMNFPRVAPLSGSSHLALPQIAPSARASVHCNIAIFRNDTHATQAMRKMPAFIAFASFFVKCSSSFRGIHCNRLF